MRLFAIEALGKLGDKKTHWMGKDAVEVLIERLKKLDVRKHEKEGEALIWALGRLRDGRANEVVDQKRWESGENSVFWDRTKIPFRWIPLKMGKERKDASYYWKIGKYLYLKKKYKKSLSFFTKAIQLNPRFAKAYNNRGLAYYGLKNYRLAIADFTQAIQLNSRFSEAYNNRGVAYYALKAYGRAISDYNQPSI